MPASSASTTNTWKSESMLLPTLNKSDVADQMKALRRKIVSTDFHKEAKPMAEKTQTKKKTCLCSPTTHPGSFRCRLHRAVQGRHHPSSTVKESNDHDVPNLTFKFAGNLSPSKLSRFCSSR